MLGYECFKCKKTHSLNSAIGKAHYQEYIKEREKRDKLAEIERAKETPETKEQIEAKLFKAIFG